MLPPLLCSTAFLLLCPWHAAGLNQALRLHPTTSQFAVTLSPTWTGCDVQPTQRLRADSSYSRKCSITHKFSLAGETDTACV